jgi:RNA polymerase sigma-70 factor (ECF subfamily)
VDELDESLSMAFLVLLESLNPVERAVFILREVFDYDYEEISHIVGKSEANCRQIARRARQSVAARRPRFESSPEQEERLTQQFVEACMTGDMEDRASSAMWTATPRAWSRSTSRMAASVASVLSSTRRSCGRCPQPHRVSKWSNKSEVVTARCSHSSSVMRTISVG